MTSQLDVDRSFEETNLPKPAGVLQQYNALVRYACLASDGPTPCAADRASHVVSPEGRNARKKAMADDNLVHNNVFSVSLACGDDGQPSSIDEDKARYEA